MKGRFFLFFVIVFALQYVKAQEWRPVGDKLMTKWGKEVTPKNVHLEYPRPQLKRSNNWINLNGLWDYAILDKDVNTIPSKWDGRILVPFAVESALSGVGKRITKDQALWYNTVVNVDKKFIDKEVLLHFGAVDWECDVYVNGNFVGNHQGGFDPFFFNITDYLKKGTHQDIVVRVWDPTNDGPQPRGKQINNPHGIWYTPVSGIWQTVWLEGVSKTHIVSTKQTPDIDKSVVDLILDVSRINEGDELLVEAFDQGNVIAQFKGKYQNAISLEIANPVLWSPNTPKLYDLRYTILRKGKVVDQVDSYFAMRKISQIKDRNGVMKMALNDTVLFQYGPLDQGWWPDGLHTAPSDEALMYDIQIAKDMGFNMIRKHIKVEPARWYRHCDSIGMLVWQDMPSGDLGGNIWEMQVAKVTNGTYDKIRSPESELMFRKEWESIMDALHNFPSIVVWVPFNEAWGQFKTTEITDWTKTKDPSRLVNSASGGNFFYVGDILDIHNYPDAAMPDPKIFGEKFSLALGEFGGLGLPVEGHNWQEKNNWGYQSFKTSEDLTKRYRQILDNIKALRSKGLSAAVYTQITDVEIETNGLITYDRAVIKIPLSELKIIHGDLYQ